MARSLLYGNDVLDMARLLSPKDRTILFVRHSERPSFDNIPISEWDGVGLTKRGIEVAGDFGRELAWLAGGAKLRVYGSGLQRSLDTAAAIAEGVRKAGGNLADQRTLKLKSPVADRPSFVVAQLSGHWLETVKEWLGGATDNPMVPIHEYGPVLLRSLLDPTVAVRGETSVVVTHDLHIMALSSYIFGVPVGWTGFLDGPVLKVDDTEMQAGIGDLITSMPLAQALR